MKVPIYYTVLYFKLMHYKYWRITAVYLMFIALSFHSMKVPICGHFIQWKSQYTILYFISSWCIINIEGSQLFIKCSLCGHFIQWKCLYTCLLTNLMVTVQYIYFNHYNTWHLLMKYLHTAICNQVVSYSCYTCVKEAIKMVVCAEFRFQKQKCLLLTFWFITEFVVCLCVDV